MFLVNKNIHKNQFTSDFKIFSSTIVRTFKKKRQ